MDTHTLILKPILVSWGYSIQRQNLYPNNLVIQNAFIFLIYVVVCLKCATLSWKSYGGNILSIKSAVKCIYPAGCSSWEDLYSPSGGLFKYVPGIRNNFFFNKKMKKVEGAGSINKKDFLIQRSSRIHHHTLRCKTDYKYLQICNKMHQNVTIISNYNNYHKKHIFKKKLSVVPN